MDFDSLGCSRTAFNYSIINPIIHWFYSKYFIFFKGMHYSKKDKKKTRRICITCEANKMRISKCVVGICEAR